MSDPPASTPTLHRRRFIWAVSLLVLVVSVHVGLRARQHRAIPLLPVYGKYGKVPPFVLTDQQNRPISQRDLEGKVWIADFIFTHCPEVCVHLTEEMADLQTQLRKRRLHQRVRLVSFSVDPDNDTPDRLADYARRFRADSSLWHFLTGRFGEIQEAAEHGFRLTMQKADAEGGILHGTRFVLVDSEGDIRGYYDIDDASAKAELLGHVEALAADACEH